MILATCDRNYLHRVRLLISSCARHIPDQRFYLYLINSDKPTDREIQSWHPNLILEKVRWRIDPDNWRALMCSARALPLETVLKKYNEKVIYLDSDTLVRKSIHELLSILDKNDLTVKYRPQLNQMGAAGTHYAAKFNNGVIGIRPSPIGIKFAQRYNELIQEHIASGKPLEHHLKKENITSIFDQELLFLTYLEFQDDISFYPLPEKFNDARFSPNSIIWHGKGTAYNHPLYTTERYRYEYPRMYYPLGLASQGLSIIRYLRNLAR